jgi:hypothetical protein
LPNELPVPAGGLDPRPKPTSRSVQCARRAKRPGQRESFEVVKEAGKVLRENLREHPAVRAWSGLAPACALPDHVVVLKRKAKGAVYRLAGVGPEGRAVIAKRAHREKAVVERAVYERVLPRLPRSPVGYHGFVDEADGSFTWLFLEDVGDERYLPLDREHRALAAHGLALLHTVADDAEVQATFPERGVDHHRGYLRSIAETLPRSRALPTLPPRGREVLDRIAAACPRLESSWSGIEALCAGAPQTLVHGDCLAKNVHVRSSAAGRSIAPFDWGGAGWGIAATDLGQLALPLGGPPEHDPDYAGYLDVALQRWPALGLESVRQLANLGQLFWALKVIARGLPELECEWARPEDVAANLGIYAAALARSMRAMGSG